jgi:hypothetical protein
MRGRATPVLPQLRTPPPATLLEAKVVTLDWRVMCSTTRPHSSLGWMAPAGYAKSCRGG